jgi:hypothetical protein
MCSFVTHGLAMVERLAKVEAFPSRFGETQTQVGIAQSVTGSISVKILIQDVVCPANPR